MDNIHSILIVAVSAIVTAALRFLPFLIFGGNKETPLVVTYRRSSPLCDNGNVDSVLP